MTAELACHPDVQTLTRVGNTGTYVVLERTAQ